MIQLSLPAMILKFLTPRSLAAPGVWAWACLVIGMGSGLMCYGTHFDITVTQWTRQTLAGQAAAWQALTHLGDGWVQVLGCGLAAAVLWQRYNAMACQLILAAPLSLLAGLADQVFLKIPFGRPRPKLWPELYDFQWFETAGSLRGFPSGHALTTLFILGFLWAMMPGKLRLPLMVIAGVVAFSRVAVGAHYLGDTLAGAGLGMGLGLWAAQCYQTRTTAP